MISLYFNDIIIIIYHVFHGFFLFLLHLQSSSTHTLSCHHQAITHSICLFVFTYIITLSFFFSVFNLYKKKVRDSYVFLPLLFFFSPFFGFFLLQTSTSTVTTTNITSWAWLSDLALLDMHVYTYELPSKFDLRVFV